MSADDIDEVESRLTRTLERAPEVAIPDDFVLKVAARMQAQSVAALRKIPVSNSNVGGRVAMASAVALLVAMFVLARLVGGSGAMGWLEVGLAIEFAVLTAWLGLRPVLGGK